MQLNELAPWLLRIVNYYERKFPSDGTINEWMQDLEHIPNDREFWEWLIKTVKVRYSEAFPKGFPRIARQMWGEWRKDNPSKYSRNNSSGACTSSDCEDGLIFCREWSEVTNQSRSMVFACSECGRKTHLAIPRISVEEAKRRGLDLDSISDRSKYFVEPQTNRLPIDGIADEVERIKVELEAKHAQILRQGRESGGTLRTSEDIPF